MVYLYSTTKMMHGPINLRFTNVCFEGSLASWLVMERIGCSETAVTNILPAETDCFCKQH